MGKFDYLKAVSAEAAEKARRDCADKIARLSDGDLDELIRELSDSGVARAEVDRLVGEMCSAAEKNRRLRDLVGKSQDVCQAVLGIIKRFL